jgi:hypothetical protein
MNLIFVDQVDKTNYLIHLMQIDAFGYYTLSFIEVYGIIKKHALLVFSKADYMKKEISTNSNKILLLNMTF